MIRMSTTDFIGTSDASLRFWPIFALATLLILAGKATGQSQPSKEGDREVPTAESPKPLASPSPTRTPISDSSTQDETTNEPASCEELRGNADRDTENTAAVSLVKRNPWYVRPTSEERRRRYIRSVVGPVAFGRYTAIAGILTGRNAPSEWGGKWDGFGRRFASSIGESAIKNTVKYGLDEALEVDSQYYLSRNRRPIARARNAVFSSVTSRNRNGRRVIGIPQIAGHLAANVASAELWYPQRYTYRHGLKGAAISLAVDAGINLFREFIWKR